MISKAKYKAQYRRNLKILTPKQMFQRLLITLSEVKADNTSENLQNKISQIIYSLYWAKEITKKRIIYKEFNKVIKENGYYIYEFWK